MQDRNIESSIVRPHPNGNGNEMISGHRRKKALEINDIPIIKAEVQDLDDDEATIVMVDTNIKREDVLPSEKGFAFKMRMEAMKRQGKRTDLTCTQLEHKLEKGVKSIAILAKEDGESKNQIQRYIRTTHLIKELRDMVDGIREDNKKIALNPAVELSYLSDDLQESVLDFIIDLNTTPSLSQAIRMKKAYQNSLKEDSDSEFTCDDIYGIMIEEKPNQKEKVSFKIDDINKYFPKNYTPSKMQETIITLLDSWAKKRNKEYTR